MQINCWCIEIKVISIIESIKYNPLGCFGVLDCFYDENENLILVFERQSNRESVFIVKDNNKTETIQYDDIKYKSGIYHSYEKNGITYGLHYGYKVLFSSKEILFHNNFIETEFGDNPVPYYMYITDQKDEIVFNFNLWRQDKPEFYPKSYYNSLSQEKNYTAEEQKKKYKYILHQPNGKIIRLSIKNKIA